MLPNDIQVHCTLTMVSTTLYSTLHPSQMVLLFWEVTHHLAASSHSGQDLLWIPKRGNIAPNVDRVKLLAANALAAYVGYASTRNVKMPEYTNMVLVPLSATRLMSTVAQLTQLQKAHFQ